MRYALTIAAAIASTAWTAAPTTAQTRASEVQILRQTISGTVLEIEYSRPSVRGRQPVFGGLVPWGEVWTPGANEATQLESSKDFSLAGVAIPAGAYTLWLQPLEDAEWQFMLHADTSLYHAPHPKLDEAAYLIPVVRTASTGFVETLTWDIQTVRAAGADLVLRWGGTEVALPLGVDPGFTVAVAPEVAAEYIGSWMMDMSMTVQSDEELEEMRAEFEAEPDWSQEQWDGFMEFLDGIRVPQSIEVTYDPERQSLQFVHPMFGPSALLPKADGIFAEGGMRDGEIWSVSGSFWEFLADDAGTVTSFEVRNPETDELEAKGCRIVADGRCQP